MDFAFRNIYFPYYSKNNQYQLPLNKFASGKQNSKYRNA